MPLRVRELKDVSILDMEGNIDINSSDIIETIGWLLNSGKLHIVLNLENVGLVDYNGLSVLAIAYKNVVNHKGRIKFLNVGLSIMELLRVVKLDSIFETYADESTCVCSFSEECIEKMQLRRKFKRLDMHLKVRYRIVSDRREKKVFEGTVLNISAIGLYIYTPHTFPINSQLELEFILPDTQMTLEATGKSVWLADKQLQSHISPGMGVSFVHLSNEKEKAIVDFIDKNITYRADS